MPINIYPEGHFLDEYSDSNGFDWDKFKKESKEYKEYMKRPTPQSAEFDNMATMIDDLVMRISEKPTDPTLDFLESVKKEVLAQLQLVDKMIERRKAGE